MSIRFFTRFCRQNYRAGLILLTIVLLGIVHYGKNSTRILESSILEKSIFYQTSSVSKHVDIINLRENIKANFTCVKTKYLLHIVQTTICVHDIEDAVSTYILHDRIWEQQYLTELLGFLIRYPQMNFIDVGANIGTYTMFVASLGRLVLAIECFKPNIDRIRRAVQIEKLQSKVTLIGNAIFSESGKYMKMTSDPSNIGGQAIILNSNTSDSTNDTYTIKTIRFDDILPVLKEKNIRNVVMKVDIQSSESFLCESGSEVFDYLNLPVVLMEWEISAHYEDRLRNVLKFFLGRGYIATVNMCQVLNESQALQSWPADVYWMKIEQSKIC